MGRFGPNTWEPAVNVLTWFLMTTAILCVLTRLGTKFWIFRRWTTDDYLSIVSMVLCAAQSIALSMAIANGYGEHFDTLTGVKVEEILKSQYAAALLFIMAMCHSKLALIHFIWGLTPATSDRRIAVGLEVFIIIWAVTAVIASAFQCKPPRTWDYINGQCFDIRAWWNYFGITNILSEAGIITQALLIISDIQAHWTKKVTLVSIFGLRIFVIAGIIGQLVYTNKTTISINPTSATWSAIISTQIVQCLSVVTACSPQFKPFMDSLRSTGMRIDGMTTSNMTFTKRYGISSTRIKSTLHSNEDHDLAPIIKGGHQITVTAAGAISECDAESQSSQTHIIREIRTFSVTESPRNLTSER
ncbi:hypothetical protein BDV29DRAFT_184782 [Aspergillus leporis]|uniref:Rhodopsin domain-containing protein n=1 Tax=Aspergillus leporis TaxID=41062 RepID=A0A5N5WKT8_9EURO|nr:hypothetical protein BDV29DRAFT_184782 [Aspergillus leporis]